MELREVTLPSEAILKLQPAPYAPAKALFNACMKEMKGIAIDKETEIGLNFLKDLFCAAITSPEIEKAMIPCLKAALINDLPITDKTFEPVKARQDHFVVMFEVAKENVLPFLSQNLSARLSEIMQKVQDSPSQK